MAKKRRRTERVEDLLLEVVSEVFRKVKDQGIPSEGLVSFLRVEVAPDLGYADIFYSYLGNSKKLKGLQEALERSSGFMRREINKMVRLRKVPELRFIRDEALEKGAEILTLLEEVRLKDLAQSAESADSSSSDSANDSAAHEASSGSDAS